MEGFVGNRRHGLLARICFFTGYFLIIFAMGTVGSAIVISHTPQPVYHHHNPDNWLYAAIGIGAAGLSLTALGRRLARAGW
jgi:hypothetical protein